MCSTQMRKPSMLDNMRSFRHRYTTANRNNPAFTQGSIDSGCAIAPALGAADVEIQTARTLGDVPPTAATACQRSARASCYGVRLQFWTRGAPHLFNSVLMPAFSVASRIVSMVIGTSAIVFAAAAAVG